MSFDLRVLKKISAQEEKDLFIKCDNIREGIKKTHLALNLYPSKRKVIFTLHYTTLIPTSCYPHHQYP